LPDKIYIGNQRYRQPDGMVRGGLVNLDGMEYYVIENYDLMGPFLMSIVSSSDHWMYISSTGGLTAGRKNPDNAIFPYYTDDKIHESYLTTGSKTVILYGSDGKELLWEPFTDFYKGVYNLQGNLYKNLAGNRVIFEEVNKDLNLVYRYEWMNSERFGWIKKSSLVNKSKQPAHISVLDGIRNILPYGVTRQMQNEMSTLVDAYKKSELDLPTGLGIFRLASIPVDRAVPSEALKCTTVWFTGYKPLSFLLGENQHYQFKQGKRPETEKGLKGIRGCYFTVSDFELKPLDTITSYYVIELEQDSTDVEELVYLIGKNDDLHAMIEKDVFLGTEKLHHLVSLADGIQNTADKMTCIRHFSNVLFNSMRGGIFENDYEIGKEYYTRHVQRFNKRLFQDRRNWLDAMPDNLKIDKLLKIVKETGDADLLRLTCEYLPLSFSRRHGDPSRPWNQFDIRLKGSDGKLSHSYQGNWRDIFQNWEALALSYPGFLPSMISRFLNSSTVDGYNPYRISSEGIDWEVPDPDDPWAYIGYWGDHQIVYLLKLLELEYAFSPGQLNEWLDLQIFSYANVPYTIKRYQEIILNPYNTIDFDENKNKETARLSSEIGADGKMVMDNEGNVLKASFTEKILVSVLARLVNFIPGAGIWMNTQRPEWNDANNALVGNGASMVTLYYMRRMMHFLRELYNAAGEEKYRIRNEVYGLFNSISSILMAKRKTVAAGLNDNLRKEIMDEMGKAGSTYRQQVYKGFSESFNDIARGRLIDFLDLVSEYIDISISENRREDGLFNAYNLINITKSSVEIIPLQEMLEGQVAALSSGIMNPGEAIELIESLYNSDLFRADQNSFMLYPDKELKPFRSSNIIRGEAISGSRLLRCLVNDGDKTIINKNIRGNYHFNGLLKNSEDLHTALNSLNKKYRLLVEEERELIAGIYESVFQHKMFTGRSGSFYKYEGLGCIYWHMVSKMLLATGEYVVRAFNEGFEKHIPEKLAGLYYRIRSGIGIDKSPSDYGAFPGDPYSHTPSMMGVQQPGMTGQVKEDIVSRFFELGIKIDNGRICFNPVMLRRKEFVKDGNGSEQLEFTFCNTTVRYFIGEKTMVKVYYKTGEDTILNVSALSSELSKSVFERNGKIRNVDVIIPADKIFDI